MDIEKLIADILTPGTQAFITTAALLFTVLLLIIAVIASNVCLTKAHGTTEKLVFIWLFWDMLVHFIMEGSFVYFSLTSTVLKSSGPLAAIWKDYARADARWGVSEPNIVSMELFTVLFCGNMCWVVMYGQAHNKVWRHYAQLVLCVCELYGGWMTFGPEWIIGSPNLCCLDDPMKLWVFLTFFNGLWVIIPLLLMYQSYLVIVDNAKQAQKTKSGKKH
ncbi:hypothetical protein SmJEL517_g02243 [Synchytrium microbalum]|uniref:EXPERA domain-containing protein n=1 Tax=Synchytrium microbalum TaxID=1806994 RepID=A0A507CCP8_9FUNG|nr:uncharacterized protein SmJEL517_g02243 [Synchytrium microbalum]TPX35335.1 hypothetical protein SmJEL517_g02243 [Synchytrium microbalum]